MPTPRPFLGSLPCSPKVPLEHRKSEPVRIQDPESGLWFDRIICADCGKQLSDRHLNPQPIAEAVSVN